MPAFRPHEPVRGDRGAAAQYDILRGKAVNAWAAEMQWLAGSALANAGDMAAAQQRWQAAIDAEPKSRFAHQALVALLDAGAPVDEYQRGLVDYYNGLYQLALESFPGSRKPTPCDHISIPAAIDHEPTRHMEKFPHSPLTGH